MIFEDSDPVPVENGTRALVYQDFALFPHLDVTQNILYGTRYHHISKQSSGNQFDHLIAALGSENHTGTHNPSGGENSAWSWPFVLILNPKVLLLLNPCPPLTRYFDLRGHPC